MAQQPLPPQTPQRAENTYSFTSEHIESALGVGVKLHEGARSWECVQLFTLHKHHWQKVNVILDVENATKYFSFFAKASVNFWIGGCKQRAMSYI